MAWAGRMIRGLPVMCAIRTRRLRSGLSMRRVTIGRGRGGVVSGTGTRKTGTAKADPPVVAESVLVAEVGSGDHRRALEALRDRLAADLDVAPPTVSAQLAAQLRATLAEIAGLPVVVSGSVVDDLIARRKARGAKTA